MRKQSMLNNVSINIMLLINFLLADICHDQDLVQTDQ